MKLAMQGWKRYPSTLTMKAAFSRIWWSGIRIAPNIIRRGCWWIRTKLEDTTLAAIALSVYVTNLFAVPCIPNFLLYFWDTGKDYGAQYYIQMFSAGG